MGQSYLACVYYTLTQCRFYAKKIKAYALGSQFLWGDSHIGCLDYFLEAKRDNYFGTK